MKNQLTVRKRAVLWIGRFLAALSACSLTALTAFAAPGENNPNANLEDVTRPIEGLVKQVFNVAISLVTVIGAIYCISLGVKFARAEEPQEREKAKTHLKNAIIGYVLIFILVVALRLGTPRLLHWMDSASGSSSSAAS